MTASALDLRTERGWRVGFSNMLDKEYGSWWRTHRWLVHLFLWLGVINGLIMLVGFGESQSRNFNPLDIVAELTEVFLRAGGTFSTIGIIVAAQGAVLGERQLGTAEWVLSKPVSRTAFLLSKLVVYAPTFVFLAVVIPSVAFYLEAQAFTGLQPPFVPFLLGSLLQVLQLVFYLTLTLMLGALFNSRGAVAGAAVGFLIAGFILPNFFPWMMVGLPWALPELSAAVALGRELPGFAPVPIAITLGLIPVLAGMALWRFQREEF